MSQSAIITFFIIGIVIVGGGAFGIYQLIHNDDVELPQEEVSSTDLIVVEPPVLPVEESTVSIWQPNVSSTEYENSGDYIVISTSTFSTSTLDYREYEEVPVTPKIPKGDTPIDPDLNKPTPTIKEEPTSEPPVGFTAKQLSPYYQKIGFSLNADGFSVYGRGELGDKKVNITGWRFKTNIGETLIPEAVNYYDSSGLAREEDIVIGSGDTINGYITVSPVGKNIRLNKCIGHLNNNYENNPRFPSYCPELYDRNELIKFSGRCQSFIMSLDSCRKPSVEELNNTLGYEADQCQAFFKRFDYTSCYNRYYWTSDFLGNEWRIWLGAGIRIDPEHDWVKFFDKDGLLVDSYIY
ncbi:MAG: hypothetical protein QMD50_01775 [Patescibacteria group bacterium]|nr:hypothetical protein [Patescibacteria group bacterium]